ncbi:Alpha carbonic anhydrase [Corchorus capsularis]|uniref:Carbonic anhydrase n=1 Tax=Corchorus capsularis TaxID=210143 RepID=A0A1R3FZ54_COCAP|nr:Alpha carbonic anhydrase [Corchorus capsularis]
MKCFAILLFASLIFMIPSQTEGQEDFNYDESSGKGPSQWGSLRPEWQTCGSGQSQSPIDIPVGNVVVASDLGDLQASYSSRSAVLKNRGHDIAVLWNGGDAGNINIDGIDYKILQCHWHSPSEHTIGGTRHDLEIHIVHQDAQKQIAVLSMLFQIGQPDSFLSGLLSAIENVGGGEVNLGNKNPGDIGFVGRDYYRYEGSLSTPPCTEGVVWTVFREVKTASTEQIQALKAPLAEEVKDNSRPTQSLNGREVLLYQPSGSTGRGGGCA